MEVFWSNGYEAASTQELVERTGLGRGSLYNAFGSKQGLYHKALKCYQEYGIQAQSRILERPGTVKERLRVLMQQGIEDKMDPARRRGCMVLFSALERAGKDPVVAQINQTHVHWLEQMLCQLFAEGQRRGEVSAERSALSLARAFMSSYYGLHLLGRSRPQQDFLEDTMESILAQF